MASGRLGAITSRYGELVFGVHEASSLEPSASSIVVLTQSAEGVLDRVRAESALALDQQAVAEKSSVYVAAAISSLVMTQESVGRGPFYESPSNALAVSDLAHSGVYVLSADSVLVLVDIGRLAETHVVSASSPLALSDSAARRPNRVSGVSTLALVSLADHVAKSRSADNELELTDSASGVASKLATSEITLSQEAVQGIIGVSPVSTLDLDSGSVASRQAVFERAASSAIATVTLVFDLESFSMVEQVEGLQDSASSGLVRTHLASNVISFSQAANRSHVRADGIDCLAESTLNLNDEGRLSKQESAASSLAMSQSATAQVGRGAASDLSSLGSAADFTIVRAIGTENQLEVLQAVAFVLERSDTLCSYSPFIGSSSDPSAPTPPSSTYTAAGATPGFRLQYPASGAVTDQLILRAPNLGNQDRLAMTRINRETRGGTLIIYADPIWPKVETLLLSFSGLSQEEGQSLLTFMENYLGQEIRLIDWEDRLWRGVIVNPQDPVVPDGPGCNYTASFEFEGEKV